MQPQPETQTAFATLKARLETIRDISTSAATTDQRVQAQCALRDLETLDKRLWRPAVHKRVDGAMPTFTLDNGETNLLISALGIAQSAARQMGDSSDDYSRVKDRIESQYDSGSAKEAAERRMRIREAQA